MTEILPPRASSLVESMRDIGYSLEAAIADIIDNSITAGASYIEIQYGWKDEEPWLAIRDNGSGMTEAVLVEAMRLGSRDPLENRGRGDLGRFGLGLKTASFSQCRKLTVFTKGREGAASRRWDLDLVRSRNEWILETPTAEELEVHPCFQGLGSSGTCVVWERIDRLDLGDRPEISHQRLNARLSSIREHLSLVFHRYLTAEPGRRKLVIEINGLPVEPTDPFNSSNLATSQMPKEVFHVGGEVVEMQPYILPHHSKVSTQEYDRYSLREGYLGAQGFYIYRNRRLIIHGTWFRMARQEQLTKLARVRVDIPNTLDHLWTIDVRKSRAHPPEAVATRMSKLVETIKEGSRRPYLHRGRVAQQRSLRSVWQRKVFNNRIEFEIDDEHPVISEFQADLPADLKDAFTAILRMIGSSFPKALVFNDMAERPKEVEREVDASLLKELADMLVRSRPGIGRIELHEILSTTDPFPGNPKFIESYVAGIPDGEGMEE